MIHTVTMNPTLDITYVLDRISFGEVATAVEVQRTPGGKGINVSRALHAMGVDSVAMGLLGGHSGVEVLELLQEEGLILQIVRIDSDTRTNVVVLGREDGRELVIRAAGPLVEENATERLGHLLFGDAVGPEMVALSGSIPPGASEDTYRALIARGNSRGSRMVLDSTGGTFRSGIEAGPYLVKPNLGELEELACRRLADDREIAGFARGLHSKGVSMVVVSLGRDGALLVTPDEAWRGFVPVVEADTVGAGDSMVAGLMLGISRDEPVETIFRTGLAFGLAAVLNPGPGLAEPALYDRAVKLVRVERMSGVDSGG